MEFASVEIVKAEKFIMEIAKIINAIQLNRIRITDHADEESESDQLTFDEI